ncbi:Rieske (2Fe-2S) protein [Nocardia sp. NPDC050710]|uniref:QcrA and Rieske domain-containing protein n=1 Tax=Nocardia sp. NPDC050710 TaxID=3157220 RepID=UPI0033DB3AE2
MNNDDLVLDRRTVVAGAGLLAAATLAACTTYGDTDSAAAPAPAAPPAPAAQPGGASNILAKISDVPVGSGVIVGDTVVTQPSAGTFVGLDSTCPHAGCKVNAVANGTINCPCHGSKFGLDGSVVSGPAARALSSKSVRVEGDSIVAG